MMSNFKGTGATLLVQRCFKKNEGKSRKTTKEHLLEKCCHGTGKKLWQIYVFMSLKKTKTKT